MVIWAIYLDKTELEQRETLGYFCKGLLTTQWNNRSI